MLQMMRMEYHNPVLLKESVNGLNIKPDGIYVDVTFGGGGHSREILKRLNEKGRLFGFDQDEDAAKNKIHSIIMHDKHGGTYTYLVKSFKSNTEVKPFTFNSSEFPNVEVIDLR